MWSKSIEVFNPYEALSEGQPKDTAKKKRKFDKELAINIIKLGVLIWVTMLGFFTTYALIWVGLGIPTGTVASLVVLALTCASEFGLYKLLSL